MLVHCVELQITKLGWMGMPTSSNPGPSIVMGCEFDIDCDDAGTECEGGRGCRTPVPFGIPLGAWTGLIANC